MKLSKLDPDFYAGSVAALPVFFINDQDGGDGYWLGWCLIILLSYWCLKFVNYGVTIIFLSSTLK